MTRCIVIVTLALTANLSVDHAFAQVNPATCHPDTLSFSVVAHIRNGPGTEILYVSMYDHMYQRGITFDSDDVVWGLAESVDQLITIIAVNYGSEAAYELLLDMGFDGTVATEIVWDVLVDNEFVPMW